MISRNPDKVSIAGKKICQNDSKILTKIAKTGAGIPFDRSNHDN
jgi:hypothetical protein